MVASVTGEAANSVLAISAIAAVLVSVAGVIASVWVARSTSRDMDRSAEAMERSAGASEESAQSARAAVEQQSRIADAVDALATRSDEQQVQYDRLLNRPVSWVLRHQRASVYELTNEGSGWAYDVTVSAENAIRLDGQTHVPQWGPQTGEAYIVAGSMQTGTPTIIVSWRDAPHADVQKWQRPLPPRG